MGLHCPHSSGGKWGPPQSWEDWDPTLLTLLALGGLGGGDPCNSPAGLQVVPAGSQGRKCGPGPVLWGGAELGTPPRRGVWGAPGVGAEAAPSLGGMGTPLSTCASANQAPKSPNHSALGSPAKTSPAPQRRHPPDRHPSRPGKQLGPPVLVAASSCLGVPLTPRHPPTPDPGTAPSLVDCWVHEGDRAAR